MKLRTSQQALDAIDGELAWRTKELNNLCRAVKDSRETFSDNLTRAAFTLVYAHWEGGVKKCATYYLDFVTRQKHSYEELRSNFVAIACANAIQQAASSGKLQQYAQVVDFLIFNQEERFQRSNLFEIQTESNLSSAVMESICFNVGIKMGSNFELSRNFIDRSLLKTRNSIAHGSAEPVDYRSLNESREKVVRLLTDFRTELQNSIVQKKYLR
ncbi:MULTISPECIES: MAE_28990/MAE_18760 family HEPN-like nuclease [Xanthomonas]|uniref:MAE_28990/MAE_18760 family HEPN-like nuclease n=1 Tax=Xanthomonas TaxID=338 RepID=UPI00111584E3|nr:MAE_28990/MAE_18760 family HEPN-like nuclease [Xanthomonas campestris]WDJ34740.1 hypothetical protein JH256_21880 [Xanthomonas campestris pv. campestris]WDJ81068.1 hypothetical protein JH309_21855 [Xanthomonas campestris pv. campestris]WVL60832.1 MAE_28990/MAE_18760 family HEPN-like nuclease [Xanthomonas campestris pv. barbareae]CAD7387440.1 hypothetical protein X12_004270 [Xanthomonas arboricola]